MDYRKSLYDSYVTGHTSGLYGAPSKEAIEAQFPIWKAYFGRWLPAKADSRIVDVGCGNGGFLHFLHLLGYVNAVGVDWSREQIEVAHKLGIEGAESGDVFYYLESRRDLYDIVFIRDVLEHFRKDEALTLLSAVRGALVPEGVVVIQTPNLESPFAGALRYGDLTHELGLTRVSLKQALSATGFEDVNCHPAGPVPKGFRSSLRFAVWKGIESLFRLCTLMETGSAKGIFTQSILCSGKKSGQER